MINGPSRDHQPATTPSEDARTSRECAAFGQLAMQRREELPPLRPSLRFARVDTRHGNTRREELLVHPLLVSVGQSRERRRVEDPGLWFLALVLRGQQHKGRSALDEKSLAGKDEFLDGRVGFGTLGRFNFATETTLEVDQQNEWKNGEVAIYAEIHDVQFSRRVSIR